jgi:hypothetical protein
VASGLLLLGVLPSSALAQDTKLLDVDSASIEYVATPEAEAERPAHPWAEKRNAHKEKFKRPWRSNTKGGRWRAIGIGTAGVAGGFLAHELGHVLMNLAYGNVPTFEGVRYGGFIPFFRISPGVTCNDVGCFYRNGDAFKGGRTGVYLITSAGFNVQHLTSELILSIDPQIRYHRSPFQKGMLFFNLSLSVGYALSTWFQVKPPIGDIYGMANASQLNPNWIALLVMIPAGLNLYRFFLPDSKWAPWVSRAAEATFLGVSFVF